MREKRDWNERKEIVIIKLQLLFEICHLFFLPLKNDGKLSQFELAF